MPSNKNEHPMRVPKSVRAMKKDCLYFMEAQTRHLERHLNALDEIKKRLEELNNR